MKKPKKKNDARKHERAVSSAMRRKRYLKVKHILDSLYRDQISETAAYNQIKDLGVNPLTTAWDWGAVTNREFDD